MGKESIQEFKADLFKGLAHPTRIRLLELLRHGEMSVSELQQRLGIELASVSQQLGVLRGRQLVSARREGTTVYYRLRDRRVGNLLDIARTIFNSRIAELQALRDEDEYNLEPVTGKGPRHSERRPDTGA